MEVDGAAALELGHLRVAHADKTAQLGLLEADQAAQGTLQGDGGPSPQLRGQGVPQHLRAGVVAGGAERLAQPRIILVVAVPAAIPLTMRTASTLAVRVTGQHEATLGLAGVDAAEAGGGEGHEQPRMGGHRLRDALAALEASGEQLVGIGPVGGRTGRAPGLPPGAARLQQHPFRLPVAGIDLADLTSLAVRMLDPSGQPDGVVAVAGLGDQLGPPLVAMTGPVHDLGQDAREQLAHQDRLRHATSPGAGTSGTTRSPGACSANSVVGSARSAAVVRMMAATWW
jgi:hypothetical protein